MIPVLMTLYVAANHNLAVSPFHISTHSASHCLHNLVVCRGDGTFHLRCLCPYCHHKLVCLFPIHWSHLVLVYCYWIYLTPQSLYSLTYYWKTTIGYQTEAALSSEGHDALHYLSTIQRYLGTNRYFLEALY